MKPMPLFLILSFLVAASGCAVNSQLSGPYYLSSGNYESGISTLEKNFRKNPEDGTTNYYLGRLYLADEQPGKALPYLENSALLKPKDADYQFWLGVAYSENKRPNLERQSYLKALELDKKHYQAWTRLGHNQMDRGQYNNAVRSYTKALLLKSDIPEARFNLALALHKLKRTPEEQQAWKDYLDMHPTGSKVRAAADALNHLGDFEYHNVHIGEKIITMRRIEFDPLTAEITKDSLPALQTVGETLEGLSDNVLKVVSYQKNNPDLAEVKAKNIKNYLLKKFPKISSTRIIVSWVGEPEIVRLNGQRFTLEQSIHIFSPIPKSKG